MDIYSMYMLVFVIILFAVVMYVIWPRDDENRANTKNKTKPLSGTTYGDMYKASLKMVKEINNSNYDDVPIVCIGLFEDMNLKKQFAEKAAKMGMAWMLAEVNTANYLGFFEGTYSPVTIEKVCDDKSMYGLAWQACRDYTALVNKYGFWDVRAWLEIKHAKGSNIKACEEMEKDYYAVINKYL